MHTHKLFALVTLFALSACNTYNLQHVDSPKAPVIVADTAPNASGIFEAPFGAQVKPDPDLANLTYCSTTTEMPSWHQGTLVDEHHKFWFDRQGELVVRCISYGARGYEFASPVSEARFMMQFPKVAAPTFNPPGGTYFGTQQVTLTTTTPGATIWCTTDGSAPDTTNPSLKNCDQPVVVDHPLTVRAIATKEYMNPSDESKAVYQVTLPTADPPIFNPTPPQSFVGTTDVRVLPPPTLPTAAVYCRTILKDSMTTPPTFEQCSQPITLYEDPFGQRFFHYTIEAYTVATGYNNSRTVTAEYDVGPGDICRGDYEGKCKAGYGNLRNGNDFTNDIDRYNNQMRWTPLDPAYNAFTTHRLWKQDWVDDSTFYAMVGGVVFGPPDHYYMYDPDPMTPLTWIINDRNEYVGYAVLNICSWDRLHDDASQRTIDALKAHGWELTQDKYCDLTLAQYIPGVIGSGQSYWAFYFGSDYPQGITPSLVQGQYPGHIEPGRSPDRVYVKTKNN